MATVAAEGGHDAAYHCGGVVLGGRQQGGDQGAGGGFAMAPGYGDGVLAIDQGSQHVGAVADRQTQATGLQQLRVGLWHGGADHHLRRDRGATADRGNRGGVLLQKHPHPQPPQAVEHGAVPGVGATYRVAPFRQDRCQGRHADAANPNEVERLVTIEQGRQGQLQIRVQVSTKLS